MKKLTLLFLTSLFCISVQAQSIDVKWSEQFTYDNKKDGFFDDFVGSNDNYIYAKFTDLKLNVNKKSRKVKLLAFDKNTMSKIGEAQLLGYGGATDRGDYAYYKSVTVKDQVYVFWTHDTKTTVELYVQSFDPKLKKVNDLKKVYEVTRGSKGVASDKLFIIYNNRVEGRILIAKEFGINKDGENLRLEYKLMKPDFSFITSRQVTLPITMDKRKKGIFSSYMNSIHELSCTYEFGDDGNLYVQDMVRASDEERKSMRKGEASVYPHIMQVQLEGGDVRSYRVKFPKKNSFNTSLIVTTNGVKLYGFFSDLDKDEKGRDSHGIFFVSVSNKDFVPQDTKFSYFTKTFLDELYAADKENQKKGRGIFKSDKAKASDNESIDDNYVIEKVVQDGDDILLFSSIMRNWSQTVCSSNGQTQTCRTYYYCTKNNVTAFRLDKRGEILWAKNMDRSVTYSRWNVYDLNVMKKDDSYYVVYGSAYQTNASKKNGRSRKSGQQLTDRLEYAVFQGKTGSFQKLEKQINPLNAKKADKKQISADAVRVFDNKMYVASSRYKLKPTTYIACLCPPVFLGMMYSANSRVGTGYIGTIAPLK